VDAQLTLLVQENQQLLVLGGVVIVQHNLQGAGRTDSGTFVVGPVIPPSTPSPRSTNGDNAANKHHTSKLNKGANQTALFDSEEAADQGK